MVKCYQDNQRNVRTKVAREGFPEDVTVELGRTKVGHGQEASVVQCRCKVGGGKNMSEGGAASCVQRPAGTGKGFRVWGWDKQASDQRCVCDLLYILRHHCGSLVEGTQSALRQG